MVSTDWMHFKTIMELMEKRYNGYMTFREAVYAAGLPRWYKGNLSIPNFFRHKMKAILPKGKDEQLYILKKSNETQ